MSFSPQTAPDKLTTADQVGVHNRLMVPLSLIMLIAFVIRMVAAFFSKGFAFHDDHFDVITIAQHWLYGLPSWLHEPMPPRHSMFYAGIHYSLFYLLESIGISNADTKMTIVRVLHGLYSLLIVYYGYKITERLSNQANARIVGLMLSLMWFMPFMSVRNLVEMVCIPPYLAAFYFMLKQDDRKKNLHYLWAGALFALAFVLRYHAVLFAVGAGMVLLYRRQWKEIFWLALGFILMATLIQGTIDLIFFDYPFHSVITYFFYNADNAYNYSTGPVYRFLLTILGFMVPPISVYLLLGYSRTARLAPMLFWGGLLFFVVHSLFPNKQERFILPLFPLIMVLGVIGWQDFVRNSRFWQGRKKLLAASWTFFWILNIVVAVAMSFTYTKKSRIAPLVYLSEKQDMDAVLLEFGNSSMKQPPLYYLNRLAAEFHEYHFNEKRDWDEYKAGKPLPQNFAMTYSLNGEKSLDSLQTELSLYPFQPDYVVVVGQKDMEERMQRINSLYPALELEETITPSLYDRVLHFLNPRVHKDEHVRIYRIQGQN
ncbi:glycosyltransferase family 39 protein [Pontibacter sp. HSC-14F20]|uniref:glycosyltransferase family 39 protein n=1 Tax=Pontibacter sp. HSC-14F20 TaxID=2864136 RepID=UPI001C73B21C|nr:glycosyltransferase family 39 protein [Pontibacter sp. HSC-14F20]MBX0334143.1 glycosyltransferase family 39 protein [Pontibacter sp. HSC-14F20]